MSSTTALNRAQMLERLRSGESFDVVVIGGGATGLGVAVDAASRGLKTLVVDAQDFGAGTSSRSTKLIHGGVRYMKNPRDWSLVREALAERRLLLKNAPKLVHAQAFVMPCYSWGELAFYSAGVALYSAFASCGFGIGHMSVFSRNGALCALSGLKRKGLKGAVKFYDAQFDDARTAIALMQTALREGATALNYMPVTRVTVEGDRVASVTLKDEETGETFTVKAGCFFNCAGPWVDNIRRMANAEVDSLVRISRGSHIVVDKKFMPSDAAMVIPKTKDGRLLFVIPWKDNLEIGTTDLEQGQAPFDPEITDDEIDFMVETANGYLEKKITKADVKGSFSGLRPLFKGHVVSGGPTSAKLSREHAVIPEFGNLVTVTGGKWTSYRAMAEHALAVAFRMKLIRRGGCMTRSLPLYVDPSVDALALEKRADQVKDVQSVVKDVEAYAAYCVKNTGARTAKDVLYRRLRLGELNKARTAELMPVVEAAVKKALGK